MTEAEWLSQPTLRATLKYLRLPPGDRKLRLFLCQCCRGVWHLLGERCRNAVETARRFADGRASEDDLAAARVSAKDDQKCYGVYFAYAPRPTFADAAQAAETLARFAAHRTHDLTTPSDESQVEVQRAFQRRLLYDLFGNPFRPVRMAPVWRTPAVLTLAEAAYDEGVPPMPQDELDPVHLAILSDALEEAGCTDDILSHLRSPGPRVRGCWALDLVLGKG